MIRLMMIGRAVSPLPPMAPSTHLSPPLLVSKAFANYATAAASPPEVHQWVTSQSAARAAVTPPSMAIAAAAVSSRPA